MEDILSLMTVDEYVKYEALFPRVHEYRDYRWQLKPIEGLLSTNGDIVSGTPVVYETNSGGNRFSIIHFVPHTKTTVEKTLVQIGSFRIKPILKTSLSKDNYSNGDIEVFLKHPFIHIDENLWIAEVPFIVWLSYIDESEYETSAIRWFLCKISKNMVNSPYISMASHNSDEDDLFNLSEEEFRKYKTKIPPIPCNWYLRTPCSRIGGSRREPEEFYGVKVVKYDPAQPGEQFVGESYQFATNEMTRPALRTKLNNDKYTNGDIEVFYKHPFVHIDENLWIAQYPISVDSWDNKHHPSVPYKETAIRNGIITWKKTRDYLPNDYYKNNVFLADHKENIQIP